MRALSGPIERTCRGISVVHGAYDFSDEKLQDSGILPNSFRPSGRGRLKLDAYIEHERGKSPGPLYRTKTGGRFVRRYIHGFLAKVAAQENSKLPADEQIHLHAHKLRHRPNDSSRLCSFFEYSDSFVLAARILISSSTGFSGVGRIRHPTGML